MKTIFVSRFFIIGCLLSSFLLTSWSHAPAHANLSKPTFFDSNLETDILFYINEYRGKKGLPALQMNNEMSALAEKHSIDMASNRVVFGHDGFENRVKVIAGKIGNIHSSAENVAYGNLSPKEVVDGWIKSPGHRKNIEGSYTLTGIGVATGKDNIKYFTQIFTSK